MTECNTDTQRLIVESADQLDRSSVNVPSDMLSQPTGAPVTTITGIVRWPAHYDAARSAGSIRSIRYDDDFLVGSLKPLEAGKHAVLLAKRFLDRAQTDSRTLDALQVHLDIS